jgi:hypothetical protein
MSDEYDRKELKIVRRGISVQKVLAAYAHFGSLRLVGKACNISKDTVKNVLDRYHIPQQKRISMPEKVSYNPKRLYSNFALWLQDHSKEIPEIALYGGLKEIERLSGASADTVKCYFYRRRKQAAKILRLLPDLRKLDLSLEDIEGKVFETKNLVEYKYLIDRYSERAALQGKIAFPDPAYEITAIIPSIELFAKRIKEISNARKTEC